MSSKYKYKKRRNRRAGFWKRNQHKFLIGAIAIYAIVTFIHFANGHGDASFFGIYHTAMVVKTCPMTPSAYWQFLHSTVGDRIRVAGDADYSDVDVSSFNEAYYVAYCQEFGNKDGEVDDALKELKDQIRTPTPTPMHQPFSTTY